MKDFVERFVEYERQVQRTTSEYVPAAKHTTT
jgi:hypothetical protein